jgi:hypothetical protein
VRKVEAATEVLDGKTSGLPGKEAGLLGGRKVKAKIGEGSGEVEISIASSPERSGTGSKRRVNEATSKTTNQL